MMKPEITLGHAIGIAQHAHKGQLDQALLPFIGHPLRVMAFLAGRGFGDTVLVAAILHDVLEDTLISAQDLTDSGVSFESLALIKLLTRTKDMTYAEYIQRIKDSDSNAIDIKLADLYDNTDPVRALPNRPDLAKRYAKAIAVLESHAHEQWVDFGEEWDKERTNK